MSNDSILDHRILSILLAQERQDGVRIGESVTALNRYLNFLNFASSCTRQGLDVNYRIHAPGYKATLDTDDPMRVLDFVAAYRIKGD